MRAVARESLAYWREEVRRRYFVDLAKGKEIGHKLADLVDEKTTALLTLKHVVKHECDHKERRKTRSIGDVWVEENGIYHPVNVKTGIVGSEGQPNLVSLKKVLSAILARQIDSYYLLIVKMGITDSIVPSVFFVDMLDYLDYVTFDSGPGQMMLRAKSFFASYTKSSPTPKDVREKVRLLMAKYEDAEKRLRKNREQDLAQYRDEFREFLSSSGFSVTPETQKSLMLR